MKHKYLFAAALLVSIAVLSAGLVQIDQSRKTGKEKEELLVVTSFYPVYIMVSNIVGDCENVKVESLSEPQTGCLHDYQLTPQDMMLLSEADLFVINGGGMEGFLEEVAEEYPALTVLNAGADVFEHHEVSENAHIWMSIPHYIEQVAAIRDSLAEEDPAHSELYRENAESYLCRVRALREQSDELRVRTQGEPVVLFHEAFAYMAEDYGLKVSGVLDLDEERKVSAGEVADLIRLIEEENIQMILAEELYGRDMGDTIEKETDCRVYYLDTLTRGDGTLDSWLNGMEENIRILQDVWKAGEEA